MTEEELQARRAAAEKRLAEAETKRAKSARNAELEALEKLERDAEELEAIAEAEADHGPQDEAIKVVRHTHGIVIVRKPDFVVVKRYHDTGKTTVEAKDKLGRPYVVYPSKEKYNALAADNVALISAVADAAAWLAGWGRTVLEEKS